MATCAAPSRCNRAAASALKQRQPSLRQPGSGGGVFWSSSSSCASLHSGGSQRWYSSSTDDIIHGGVGVGGVGSDVGGFVGIATASAASSSLSSSSAPSRWIYRPSYLQGARYRHHQQKPTLCASSASLTFSVEAATVSPSDLCARKMSSSSSTSGGGSASAGGEGVDWSKKFVDDDEPEVDYNVGKNAALPT